MRKAIGRNEKKEVQKVMAVESKTAGWNWMAFILGPFWYFSKGMHVKGFWLIVISLLSCFLAVPFIRGYCGARGHGDWYDFRLKEKSKINLDEI